MKCIVCLGHMKKTKSWMYECPSCGFGSSNLIAGKGRGVGGLETLRRKNFKHLCKWLNNSYALADKKILEVGCAEGWFLEEALHWGMNVYAIEPSLIHAKMSRSKGFDVIDGFFPNDLVTHDLFDFIVFNDVFEHLANPVAALAKCEELLVPGGVLVLNAPSNDGIFYHLGDLLAKCGLNSALERLWQKDLPSPHLSYFNPETMQRFVYRYSKLRHIDTLYLNTFLADGLWERIKTSHPGIIGWIIYSVLFCAQPIIQRLPPDIIVGVFEKQ